VKRPFIRLLICATTFLIFDAKQWSISSTFYACIFRTKVLRAAFSYLHVIIEKLPKRLSYKKGARKMLMKLTPGWKFAKLLKANTYNFGP